MHMQEHMVANNKQPLQKLMSCNLCMNTHVPMLSCFCVAPYKHKLQGSAGGKDACTKLIIQKRGGE